MFRLPNYFVDLFNRNTLWMKDYFLESERHVPLQAKFPYTLFINNIISQNTSVTDYAGS